MTKTTKSLRAVPTTSFEAVTPDVAREILLHNTRNRVCSQSRVDAIAAGLEQGSPVLVLRNYLLTRYSPGGRTSREELSLVVFSAFDAFLHGRSRAKAQGSAGARERYLRPWAK